MYYNNVAPSVYNILLYTTYYIIYILLRVIVVRNRTRITRGPSDEHAISTRGSSPVNRIAFANESRPDGNTFNAAAACWE